MVNKNLNGCEYGRTNRIFINEIRSDISTIKENTNHFSNRLPLWVTTLITILSSLVVGLIVYEVSS
jgi:hypothetical protein